MSWLKAVASPPAIRASKTAGTVPSNPSAWLVDLLGGPESATGIKVTEDMALTANAVWAAVKVISETIAALPLHTYRNLPTGGKAKATDYPLYELLHDQPNPEMTAMEWRECTIGHQMLWGNSYAEIQRDQAFRPIAIWPLRPDKMMVWRNEQTRQLEYIYQLWQGGTVYFAPDEILHIRTLSRDGILGLSPIGEQRETIGINLAEQRYGGALFGNGANPGGIISVPGVLTKDAKERMRQSWDEKHRGPGNAGRIAVLEQGVTWQQTGMSAEDAQYILSRQFSLTEIARIFRLSPHKLQDLSRATFSNIEQLALEFVTDTLLPYLVRFEQAARRSLVPERDRKTYFVKHAVDALLRGDMASRYAAYAQGRQWGWLSVDDILEKEDMNPLPDGKGQEYLVPLNMVPAGDRPEPVAPAPPTPPAPSVEAPKSASGDGQSARLLQVFLEDAGRRIAAREDADICRAARKWLGRRQPEEFRRWLGGFLLEHRAWIADQVRPALQVLDPEFADEMAEHLAARHLVALGQLLTDFDSIAALETRLAAWKADQPAQMAQMEARRALRGAQNGKNPAQIALSGLISRLAEPSPAPHVTIENRQAPITVQPAELHVAQGAVQVDARPTTTIAEGAVRVDVAPAAVNFTEGAVSVGVTSPPVQIAEGAVKVEVQAPPVPDFRVEEGAIRVDVAPPSVQIEPGAVQVDVQAPPPAEVTVNQGDTHVDVAAPEVTLAEGAVKVDVAAPPPAEVTIAEGAVRVDVTSPVEVADGAIRVDVAPSSPPNVTFEAGSVQVPPPPKPLQPRLQAARDQMTRRQRNELRRRRRRGKES